MKKTLAKNQATAGWRSTAITPWPSGAVTVVLDGRLRRQSPGGQQQRREVATAKGGNTAMPAACSTTPNKVTDTMKPTEPQTRTRP